MTTQSNLSFLLYLISTDEFSPMRERIQTALGCELKKTDTQGYEPMGLLDEEGTCLGMSISFCWSHTSPQGNVYRLSGGTTSNVWADDGELLSLDHYVIRLLHKQGVDTVMTREQFGSYRKRMQVDEAERP